MGQLAPIKITTRGGYGPVKLTVSNLPTGLTFTDNGDGTGQITGQVAQGAEQQSPWVCEVRAIDDANKPVTRKFTFNVSTEPTVEPEFNAFTTESGYSVGDTYCPIPGHIIGFFFNGTAPDNDLDIFQVSDGVVGSLVASAGYSYDADVITYGSWWGGSMTYLGENSTEWIVGYAYNFDNGVDTIGTRVHTLSINKNTFAVTQNNTIDAWSNFDALDAHDILNTQDPTIAYINNRIVVTTGWNLFPSGDSAWKAAIASCAVDLETGIVSDAQLHANPDLIYYNFPYSENQFIRPSGPPVELHNGDIACFYSSHVKSYDATWEDPQVDPQERRSNFLVAASFSTGETAVLEGITTIPDNPSYWGAAAVTPTDTGVLCSVSIVQDRNRPDLTIPDDLAGDWVLYHYDYDGASFTETHSLPFTGASYIDPNSSPLPYLSEFWVQDPYWAAHETQFFGGTTSGRMLTIFHQDYGRTRWQMREWSVSSGQITLEAPVNYDLATLGIFGSETYDAWRYRKILGNNVLAPDGWVHWTVNEAILSMRIV